MSEVPPSSTVPPFLLAAVANMHSYPRHSGMQQQQTNAESLLLEAAKQVKVSDLEDDMLDMPEDDPSGGNPM